MTLHVDTDTSYASPDGSLGNEYPTLNALFTARAPLVATETIEVVGSTLDPFCSISSAQVNLPSGATLTIVAPDAARGRNKDPALWISAQHYRSAGIKILDLSDGLGGTYYVVLENLQIHSDTKALEYSTAASTFDVVLRNLLIASAHTAQGSEALVDIGTSGAFHTELIETSISTYVDGVDMHPTGFALVGSANQTLRGTNCLIEGNVQIATEPVFINSALFGGTITLGPTPDYTGCITNATDGSGLVEVGIRDGLVSGSGIDLSAGGRSPADYFIGLTDNNYLPNEFSTPPNTLIGSGTTCANGCPSGVAFDQAGNRRNIEANQGTAIGVFRGSSEDSVVGFAPILLNVQSASAWDTGDPSGNVTTTCTITAYDTVDNAEPDKLYVTLQSEAGDVGSIEHQSVKIGATDLTRYGGHQPEAVSGSGAGTNSNRLSLWVLSNPTGIDDIVATVSPGCNSLSMIAFVMKDALVPSIEAYSETIINTLLPLGVYATTSVGTLSPDALVLSFFTNNRETDATVEFPGTGVGDQQEVTFIKTAAPPGTTHGLSLTRGPNTPGAVSAGWSFDGISSMPHYLSQLVSVTPNPTLAAPTLDTPVPDFVAQRTQSNFNDGSNLEQGGGGGYNFATNFSGDNLIYTIRSGKPPSSALTGSVLAGPLNVVDIARHVVTVRAENAGGFVEDTFIILCGALQIEITALAGATGAADVEADYTVTGVNNTTATGTITQPVDNQAPVLAAIGPQVFTQGVAEVVALRATDQNNDLSVFSQAQVVAGLTIKNQRPGAGGDETLADWAWDGIGTPTPSVTVDIDITDNDAAAEGTDTEAVDVTIIDATPLIAADVLDVPATKNVALRIDVLSAVSGGQPPYAVSGTIDGVGGTSSPSSDALATDFAPSLNVEGDDAGQYTYEVSDSVGRLATGAVTVDITNYPPVWDAVPAQNVLAGAVWALDVRATDTDPPIVIVMIDAPDDVSGIQFVDNADGTARVSALFFDADVYTFEFVATDEGGLESNLIVTVTVAAITWSEQSIDDSRWTERDILH